MGKFGGFQTEPTWIVAWALPIVKSRKSRNHPTRSTRALGDEFQYKSCIKIAFVSANGLRRALRCAGTKSERSSCALPRASGPDECGAEAADGDRCAAAAHSQLCTHAGGFPAVQSLRLLKKFLKEHQQEIDRRRAAKRAFNELGLQKLPSKKSLDMEYSQLLAKKKEAYAAYRDAREQARELLTHRENLRPYLAPQEASPRAKRPEQDER